jgi:NADH dehydrogenase [ubiquinone] 1 alpha subcomplex assembly factor 1
MAFRWMFSCLIALLGVVVANSSERILFNFSANEPEWGVINDGVMGGVSNSTVRVVNGVLVFSGRVRLENNGGFASNRSSAGQYNLEDFDGVVLRVRGDGKNYALNISTSDAGRVLYRAGFQTRENEWTDIKIPFSSLRPTRFGNTLTGPPFQRGLIESFGFIIANKRAEDFKLEVDWIKAFKD